MEFGEQQNKAGFGRTVYRRQNQFISIWPAFWRVSEPQKLTDENRTRTGQVESEARRGKRKSSDVNNRRYDAFFHLKGVRRCSILY